MTGFSNILFTMPACSEWLRMWVVMLSEDKHWGIASHFLILCVTEMFRCCARELHNTTELSKTKFLASSEVFTFLSAIRPHIVRADTDYNTHDMTGSELECHYTLQSFTWQTNLNKGLVLMGSFPTTQPLRDKDWMLGGNTDVGAHCMSREK